MSESTTINTRDELMKLLDLNEAGMAEARAEREAYLEVWRLLLPLKKDR